MPHEDVFHAGELAMQERSGERAIAIRHGGIIGDSISPAAASFLARQRMVALSSTDAAGAVWASLWFGEPGFVTGSAATTLVFDRTRMSEPAADPLASCIEVGAELGVLAIEPATRRRLRINGGIARVTDDRIEIATREVYPNCPKYISKRQLREVSAADGEARVRAVVARGAILDAERARTIAQADTLFVASRHPERGADASHRGGPVGFIRTVDASTLRIPDYPGNGMFNTLGNLQAHRAAGLVIPDFDRGRLLQMTGVASVIFDEEDPRYPTGGTGRYWQFEIERWIESAMPDGYRWEFVEASPYNPPISDRSAP